MQTKRESIVESLVDVGIGFIISLIATFVINWLHDLDIPIWKNFTMTMCFTFVSLCRKYLIRRHFSNRENENKSIHNNV